MKSLVAYDLADSAVIVLCKIFLHTYKHTQHKTIPVWQISHPDTAHPYFSYPAFIQPDICHPGYF